MRSNPEALKAVAPKVVTLNPATTRYRLGSIFPISLLGENEWFIVMHIRAPNITLQNAQRPMRLTRKKLIRNLGGPFYAIRSIPRYRETRGKVDQPKRWERQTRSLGSSFWVNEARVSGLSYFHRRNYWYSQNQWDSTAYSSQLWKVKNPPWPV